jgi:hypothetical protein
MRISEQPVDQRPRRAKPRADGLPVAADRLRDLFQREPALVPEDEALVRLRPDPPLDLGEDRARVEPLVDSRLGRRVARRDLVRLRERLERPAARGTRRRRPCAPSTTSTC